MSSRKWAHWRPTQLSTKIPWDGVGECCNPPQSSSQRVMVHSTVISVNLAAPPYTFPFRFEKSGWHQFVINTTWGRPTIASTPGLRFLPLTILSVTYGYRQEMTYPPTAHCQSCSSTPFSAPEHSACHLHQQQGVSLERRQRIRFGWT
jgi:hypothetical protein